MNSAIVESFTAMVRDKGVDKDILAQILEDIFTQLVKKRFGQDAQCEIVVNM
ncbi:MAG TPA: NusA N-terminal domain-containing protein, partial [Ignavibacteriales bacterium]|nr:NusA N-terminal domain-containing protein [Ignavibacteriales bacterium]